MGRQSRQAGLRAGALLEVLDEHTRPRVKQGCADEIFIGQKPVRMVVEPESQCWVAGRLSRNRDGKQWAQELGQRPALEHLVRDGGKGLDNGRARVNEQRRRGGRPPSGEQRDPLHTLREGGRALRQTQARAERAWTKAEEADKAVAKRERPGQTRTGYPTQALRKWRQAEAALGEWANAEQADEHIQQALRSFTPEGEANTREKAHQAVTALLPRLQGEAWDKFKRLLRRPQTYAYLDRLKGQIEALPVPEEVREAVVRSAGVRQNPPLTRGQGGRPGVLRGLLVVWGLLIALAGAAGKKAVQAMRQMGSRAGRASSAVEGRKSVVRMQQGRHRKMTQGLLDLKRLSGNLRTFRTGRRKRTSPYERLGVPLPPDLSWWQLLQLTPDQLRARLSAQPTTP